MTSVRQKRVLCKPSYLQFALGSHRAKQRGNRHGTQSLSDRRWPSQIAHQNVGMGQRLVAIVADFEVKKSKVKVFQANQHVGQQVSYALYPTYFSLLTFAKEC